MASWTTIVRENIRCISVEKGLHRHYRRHHRRHRHRCCCNPEHLQESPIVSPRLLSHPPDPCHPRGEDEVCSREIKHGCSRFPQRTARIHGLARAFYVPPRSERKRARQRGIRIKATPHLPPLRWEKYVRNSMQKWSEKIWTLRVIQYFCRETNRSDWYQLRHDFPEVRLTCDWNVRVRYVAAFFFFLNNAHAEILEKFLYLFSFQNIFKYFINWILLWNPLLFLISLK